MRSNLQPWARHIVAIIGRGRPLNDNDLNYIRSRYTVSLAEINNFAQALAKALGDKKKELEKENAKEAE
jgi:hypothetical protein